MSMNNVLKSEKGQVLMVTIILSVFFFIILSVMLTSVSNYVKNERYLVASSQALHIAEGGIDYALNQLNEDTGYTGESDVLLGEGVFNINITDVDSSEKLISVTSYVPNSSNSIATKTVSARASISDHIIAFHYGVQSGNGGFFMSGSGTKVNGNVYSNGNIQAEIITGSAIAANLPNAVADQSNDSPLTPTDSITFGNTSSTQDFAQSFKLSQSYSFNNVQFYIKKVGSPSNATVRILYDNSSSPGSSTGITGTLSASQVTTSYGWVSITLPTTPILTAGQTYWMVIDAGSNSSNYYILGANQSGYVNGLGKIGKYGGSWSNTSPSTLDGYFKIYLGGQTSSISGGTIGTTSDDITWANSVTNATVAGFLYCQTGSGNNKFCGNSLADPDPQSMPLSDGNIQEFKDEAAVGDPIEGSLSINSNTTMGPKKINGDVSITGGAILTVTGTIWITGNFSLTGGSTVQLDSSYGSNDGIIVIDGYVSLSGNSQFYGSGQEHSYPFLVTTSSCPDDTYCGNKDAISFGGGSGTVGLIAQNGAVSISGGSALKALAAKKVVMTGGSELIYDEGLVNSHFSSGSGGAWQFVTGTYSVSN